MSEQIVQGIIEARSRDGGGIKIGENWYNTHAKGATFPENAQPGAAVKLAFTTNGRYKNVTEGKFKVLKDADPNQQQQRRGGGGGNRGRSPEERAEIASQNALTNAVNLVSSADLGSDSLTSVVGYTLKIQRIFAETVKATAHGKPIPVIDLGGASGSAPSNDGWDDQGPSNDGSGVAAGGDWDDDIPF